VQAHRHGLSLWTGTQWDRSVQLLEQWRKRSQSARALRDLAAAAHLPVQQVEAVKAEVERAAGDLRVVYLPGTAAVRPAYLALNNLSSLVEQLCRLRDGAKTPPADIVTVALAFDATVMWQKSTTRCDVAVFYNNCMIYSADLLQLQMWLNWQPGIPGGVPALVTASTSCKRWMRMSGSSWMTLVMLQPEQNRVGSQPYQGGNS